MQKAIVKGSLTDIQQTSGKSLAETFLNSEIVVLVDTSASMGNNDAPGSISRYQAACGQLETIQGDSPGKVAVISFSSWPAFCPNGTPDNLNGGTNMVDALKFVKPVDGTDTKIVLVSDGEPDDYFSGGADTLAVARTFQTPIDVIYIGPEGGRGYQFLQQLAKLTGGKSFKSEAPGLLGEGIETLLLIG